MLGTLVDKLESLFSKRFVVGSVPLLAFLLLHGGMAYLVSEDVHAWVGRFFSLDPARLGVVSFAALLVAVVLTYVTSALSVFLREVLEGRYLPSLVSNALSQRHRARLIAVEKKLREARRHRRMIRLHERGWRERLGQAYRAGDALNPPVCTYQRPQALADLLDRRDANLDIEPDALGPVVDTMVGLLQANSPAILGVRASQNLDDDQGELLHLIDYARDTWEARVVDHVNRIQFEYAGKRLAPTRMGLVAGAAPYYAASRYSINLEIVWPRLQKILQGDVTFYPVVQDAKLYVDFLVTLVWLTAMFTVVWTVVLSALATAPLLFVAIAVLGPLLTLVWYRIALQNYQAFSELVRASVDLYRLDLLKALHLALPANAEEERALWETLEQRLGYGDSVNVALRHP